MSAWAVGERAKQTNASKIKSGEGFIFIAGSLAGIPTGSRDEIPFRGGFWEVHAPNGFGVIDGVPKTLRTTAAHYCRRITRKQPPRLYLGRVRPAGSRD